LLILILISNQISGDFNKLKYYEIKINLFMTDLTKLHNKGRLNSLCDTSPTSSAAVERLTVAYIWEIADVESKPVWMAVVDRM